MEKRNFADITFDELSLQPLDDSASQQATGTPVKQTDKPAKKKSAFQIDTRAKGDRRQGSDRRETIRFQEDRRSGNDRRPTDGWSRKTII